MSVSFNTVQQQAINEYRQANNLGYVISDEAIVQEMIKNGKLPACFSAASQPVNSSKSENKENSNITPPVSNEASAPSIFGSEYTPSAANTSTAVPSKNLQSDTKKQNVSTTEQTTAKTPEEIAAEKRENEMKTLGLQNNKGAGTQLKTANGKVYTVVGESSNGRRIIEDEEGNLQVISHDNKFLDKAFVERSNKADAIRSNPKIARESTVEMLDEQINNAQKAFDNQMAEDGWAGDVADGVSILWGSENRASKVREDLKTYNENLAGLKDAAAKGNDEFKTAFKEMFKTDYDADAVAAYVKTPTDENYQKAFGTKNNIGQRVAKYNESQQTGAAAVKTTATVAAGVAIGVATGGAGLVAIGAAAGATAAASAAINVSDRVSSDVGLKDGELTEIAKNAAWDGASVIAGGAVGKIAGTAIKGATTAARTGRAIANTAGDVAMGAAQEYAETGTVTASGTAMNAALGSVGIAAESGALKRAKNLITGKHPTPDAHATAHNSASQTPNTTPEVNIKPDVPIESQAQASVKPQTAPEQIDTHSSAEVKPQAETKPVVENPTHEPKPEAPKKHNFVQDVMSNTKESEAALKNADLSDPEVMKQYTDMFAESFPAMKNYPRKGQIIKQYQDLINHPNYNNLNDANKTIAKMCILRNSDIYPEDIAKAFNVNKYTLKRMEDMASLVNAETNPKAVASLYNKGDYEAFKVLNDVRPNKKVSAETIAQMDNYHQTAQANGNLLVKHSHITNPNDIPTKTITKNGNEYNVKVVDLTDDNVMVNLDQYGFEKGTTADNLKLTVHMNNDFNKNPRVIGRLKNSTDVSYSASITDGKTHLYGDMQVGVLLDYKEGAVSYASNYAAGTGFGKNRIAFAHTKLGEAANEHTTFIKDRFIDRMQQKGADINADDYAKISEMFAGKNMTAAQLENIAEDGFVTINNKKFSAADINEALDGSTNDLMKIRAEIREGVYFKEGFNEVNVYNADIKALYIRANNPAEKLEDILSDDLLKYAQEKNIPIVFQRYDITES